MHILLNGIANLCGRSPEQPDNEAASEDANDVGYEIKRIRFPVGGE